MSEETKDVYPMIKDIENVLESTAPEDAVEKEIKSIFVKKFSKEFTELKHTSNKDTVASLSELPDTVLLKIFSNFSLPELCHIALVCKHWLWIVYDSELWRYVDLSRYKQITEGHIVNLIQARLSPLLKSLDLSNREITPVIMNELSEHCHQLDTLVLQNCLLSEEAQQNEVGNLASVPEKLVRLDVRNFKQGFYFVHLILEANDLSNLECFGFGNNDFCPAFTEFHTIFRKMHALRILECVHCPTINDNQIKLFADELKCLESLVLTKCSNVVGSSLPYLVENSKYLKSLNLSETTVSSDWLMQTPWEKSIIEELDLSFCLHISADALAASIPKIKTLQHVALHNVGRSKAVTSMLLENAFNQSTWVNLEVLCLRFCNKLTVNALPFLERCNNLKYLSLRSCFKISYMSIGANLKFLPHLLHLECGSLLLSQESICNNWVKLFESCATYCPDLQKLILVKCSNMPLSRLNEYRRIFSRFFTNCTHLELVCVLYSEESIFKLLGEVSQKINTNIVIANTPGLEVIPRFRHSLDTELNRKRFKTFTV